MSKENEGHATVILVAFALGAIAGAASALLMAPGSGSETRRALNEKAQEGLEKADVAAKQGREFVRRQREQLTTAVERGREAYQRVRDGKVDATEGEI
tara:strand:+ start:11359 stop:11652 length:294 start_codon:yes stop_codon:yes gene_type:complete